jgi:hypothetical protein
VGALELTGFCDATRPSEAAHALMKFPLLPLELPNNAFFPASIAAAKLRAIDRRFTRA